MRYRWLWLLAGLLACQPDPEPVRLALDVSPTLADTVPYPARNPPTAVGVALGRALFYDPILSVDSTVSCATCHDPARAFTDGVALAAHGVSGRPLVRHAPTLTNTAWVGRWFWDGGATDLASQAFGPLGHPDEMGFTHLPDLIDRLRAHPTYPARFAEAFGQDTVVGAFVVRALGQFQRTLISDDAPYDRYRRGEAVLGAAARRGLTVFGRDCAGCHPPGHFTDFDFYNNGLDADFSDDRHEGTYQGRFRITQDSADLGKFRTPTLRNVALTAPYMHDGRFATLEAVLDHYADGVADSPTLDDRLRWPDGTVGVPLTAAERADLLAFLRALTDTAFVNNPAHRAP